MTWFACGDAEGKSWANQLASLQRSRELFGQEADRLREPGYRELIAATAIIVVNGFNDVLGLDAAGVRAVAIMSNTITEPQVDTIERWARTLSSGRVTIRFDVDAAGYDGAKEAHWLFAQRGVDVRLG